MHKMIKLKCSSLSDFGLSPHILQCHTSGTLQLDSPPTTALLLSQQIVSGCKTQFKNAASYEFGRTSSNTVEIKRLEAKNYLNLTRFSPVRPHGKVVNVIYTPGSHFSTHSSLEPLVPFRLEFVLGVWESSSDLPISLNNPLASSDFNVLENVIGELDKLSLCPSFDNFTSGGKWNKANGGRGLTQGLFVFACAFWELVVRSTLTFAPFPADSFSDIARSCIIKY